MVVSQSKTFVLISCILAPFLALFNYFLSAMTDTAIASSLGAFRKLPPGEFGQWTEIGVISWTFSSLLGVIFTVSPPLALLAFLYSGFVIALLGLNLFGETENSFGKGKWLLWSVILLWLVKIPVPLDYSLFYWIAVKY